MHTVTSYIGLGSNLGEPLAQLQSAIAQLSVIPRSALHGVSRFYTSKPMGPQDQPDYMNAVVCLKTTLSAPDLLQHLLIIERQHGRQRQAGMRWGPRTLDLDLLLYAQHTLTTPNLQLPHPGLCERSFVVLPLLDLAPNLILPNGKRLTDCLASLKLDDLYPLSA